MVIVSWTGFNTITPSKISALTRFNFLHSPLQFGAGEIAVAVVDCFELTAIDSDQIFSEQSQLLTQHNELATDASDGPGAPSDFKLIRSEGTAA